MRKKEKQNEKEGLKAGDKLVTLEEIDQGYTQEDVDLIINERKKGLIAEVD